MQATDILSELFRNFFSEPVSTVQAISNSASDRRYYRLISESGKNRAIGVCGDMLPENRAFVEMSRHFRQTGIKVPEVFACTENFECYIQEDLGDCQLFGMLDEDCDNLLEKTIAELIKIQFEGGKNLDYSLCFPQKEFNRRTVFWDLNYFKYEFLKPAGPEFDEDLLENDFDKFADVLLSCKPTAFMYRDFQSRNIMIRDGEPWLIDFQGGRKGPAYYDLASFIYQAKAGFGKDKRERLANAYFNGLRQYVNVEYSDFKKDLGYFALFRCLQTLGAYGFRGLVEQKATFISSIPYGIRNLASILDEYDFSVFPYLSEILHKTVSGFKMPPVGTKGNLLVKIYSFSYKKGIPADYSGNGGGFVFDCRAIHNPGRYEQYRNSTGRDQDVMEFLRNDKGMESFLNNVYDLANNSINRYLQIGFTDLMFCFGCTGGQHRSVYAAEALKKHITEKYPVVKIALRHREQGIAEDMSDCKHNPEKEE